MLNLLNEPDAKDCRYSQEKNDYPGDFIHPPYAFQAKAMPENIDKGG